MAIKNFTLSTAVDNAPPNDRFTITASKISTLGLRRDESVYDYFDEGVNHFNGDFTIFIDKKVNVGQAGAFFSFCVMANAVNDGNGLRLNTDDFFRMFQQTDGVIVLQEFDNNSFYTAVSSALTLTDQHYITLERDETVGTFGTLYMRVYSDSGRTNLLSTSSIALHTSKKDFRYIYPIQGVNDGLGGSAFYDVNIENLDLNEALDSTTVGVATAVDGGNTDIDVSMPYTDDSNTDNTYTVDYKLSADGSYTNWVTADTNTPSPYTNTITGLVNGGTYDVKVTYNDADGVTGTNPQTISSISLAWVDVGAVGKVLKITKTTPIYKVVKNDYKGKVIKRMFIPKVVK